MATPGASPWRKWLATALWMALLALLPWWLGLPLLLSLVAILLMDVAGQPRHARMLRAALRWGLPGVLLAVVIWLGGDALAWAVALLGALAGFTLLAGLEAWLDRDVQPLVPNVDRASSTPHEPSTDAWPEMVLSSRAPPASVIELVPPRWHDGDAPLRDLDGLSVTFEPGSRGTGTYCFDDGHRIDAASTQACFSPRGRWFATRSERGTMLWDRQKDRQHRLRRWQLCGWHEDQPWLQRREDTMPVSLAHALGERQT